MCLKGQSRQFILISITILGLNSSLFGTFSIVAVDTVTREVGVAAASCVEGGGIMDICHVESDKGAFIVQARFSIINLSNGRNLLNQGNSAETIIQELIKNDGQVGVRQYGIVTLDEKERSAAYTGDQNPGWKGHIVGPNYSIQGNTLAGEHICKNMETAFIETEGPLPLKLMAALQAAKQPGADRRCSSSSSLCACIKIAYPADERNHKPIRIEVADVDGDPIDALQEKFDATIVSHRMFKTPENYLLVINYPNPFNPSTEIIYTLQRDTHVKLIIVDALGRSVTRLTDQFHPAGEYTQTWDGKNQQGQDMPSGVYLCRLKTDNQNRTHKLLLTR